MLNCSYTFLFPHNICCIYIGWNIAPHDRIGYHTNKPACVLIPLKIGNFQWQKVAISCGGYLDFTHELRRQTSHVA